MSTKWVRQIAKHMDRKVADVAKFSQTKSVISVPTVNREPHQTMAVRINGLTALGYVGGDPPSATLSAYTVIRNFKNYVLSNFQVITLL